MIGTTVMKDLKAYYWIYFSQTRPLERCFAEKFLEKLIKENLFLRVFANGRFNIL